MNADLEAELWSVRLACIELVAERDMARLERDRLADLCNQHMRTIERLRNEP